MNTPERKILSILTRRDGCTIPQIADLLSISVGTATKYVQGLVAAGCTSSSTFPCACTTTPRP